MISKLKTDYLNGKAVQISAGITGAVIFILLINSWIDLEHLFLQIITLPLIAAAGQFLLTPIFRVFGLYKYYSDFLLVYGPNEKAYDLHLGTSFDYLVHMKWSDRGKTAKKKLLASMLTGLLRIIEEGERGTLPLELNVSGTSYFFSESTVRRLGFRLSRPSLFYRLNLLINFIDLYWMTVFSSGSWRFPNLLKAQKAEITLSELVNHKSDILRLQQRLTASK